MRLVEAAVNAQYIWRRATRTSAGSYNQATNNPATGETSQQAPPPPKTPSQQTSSKTGPQGAHVLQSGQLSTPD
ncbi:hypothetical protein MRX96_044196 [Rhipicephalus microplus]